MKKSEKKILEAIEEILNLLEKQDLIYNDKKAVVNAAKEIIENQNDM